MSDTTRPSRPTRRFSALKPPSRRAKPADPASPAPDAEPMDGEPTDAPRPETSPPGDASPPSSSAERPQKASDEARVAKVMARAGLCSRRDAEAWIAEGRVAVNGAVIASPALNIGPADVLTVDGYPIDKPERTRLFLFHKTRGLVTTARDPEGRPTIYDALPADGPRLVTIGRLDINTEGLLLLTNDGGLARLLELPATGWIRRYRVRANGTIDQARLDALAKGITVDGIAYAGIAAKLDRVQGANVWLTMGLKEGKNREIKRVLEHLGLAVTRLIRISFGPFQLGELAENAVEEVRTRVLRDQLGSALAQQAGVDFDGPIDLAEAGQPAPVPARTPRQDEEAPRRKTRRSATEDRRGRKVAVERILAADGGRGEMPRPARRPREDDRPAHGAGRDRQDSRPNAAPPRSRRDESPAGVSQRSSAPRDRNGSGPRPAFRGAPDGDRPMTGRPPRAALRDHATARSDDAPARPRTLRQADRGDQAPAGASRPPRRPQDADRPARSGPRDRSAARSETIPSRDRSSRPAERRDKDAAGPRTFRDDAAGAPAKRYPGARDRKGSGPRPASRAGQDGERPMTGRPPARAGGEGRSAGPARPGGKGRPGTKGGPKGRPRG